MLQEINTGRRCHEVGNLRTSLQHCLSLMERKQDMSGWCREHMEDLEARTKRVYREHLELKEAERRRNYDRSG